MFLAELDLGPGHVRTARLVAGRVALSVGLDEDTADDVGLAVGEVCARGAAGNRLQVRFEGAPGQMSVRIEGAAFAASAAGADADELGWLVINSVVPRVKVDPSSITLSWPLVDKVAPTSATADFQP